MTLTCALSSLNCLTSLAPTFFILINSREIVDTFCDNDLSNIYFFVFAADLLIGGLRRRVQLSPRYSYKNWQLMSVKFGKQGNLQKLTHFKLIKQVLMTLSRKHHLTLKKCCNTFSARAMINKFKQYDHEDH